MSSEQDAYDELRCYTLAHGDPAFIHQHVVDAFTAQRANAETKPIALALSLVGLYLFVERQFSGKQVQRAHTKLANAKQPWPEFVLPRERGSVTVREVLASAAGVQRDEAIRAWCASVWGAFFESRGAVIELLKRHGFDN